MISVAEMAGGKTTPAAHTTMKLEALRLDRQLSIILGKYSDPQTQGAGLLPAVQPLQTRVQCLAQEHVCVAGQRPFKSQNVFT